MTRLAESLLSPLAWPEVRRASARGWLIWVRLIAGAVAGGIVVICLWFWWISTQFDPEHRPSYEIWSALTVTEVLALICVLVMAPAVLAGTMAGEKQKGTLGLLLTTRVTSREIVVGRWLGRLTQVVMIVLAGLPTLVLLGGLNGFGFVSLFALMALPLAVALGAGGLSMACSVTARRGRDALMLSYCAIGVPVVLPLWIFPAFPQLDPRFGWINPFLASSALLNAGETIPAFVSATLWLGLGALGLVVASWQLAPAWRRQTGSASKRAVRGRLSVIPAVGERPMLWKELHIERFAALGRFGRAITDVLGWTFGIGTLGLAAWLFVHDLVRPGDSLPWLAHAVLTGVADSRVLTSVLLVVWVGLRASVTIANERERGTWDSLLTSPLNGQEIVRGKLWGSLFAMRMVFLPIFAAWSLAYGYELMTGREYLESLLETVLVGAFLAALGIRASLGSSTSTRAMAVTMGGYLLAFVLWAVIAFAAVCFGGLLCLVWWLASVRLGLTPMATGPSFPIDFDIAFAIVRYLLIASSIGSMISESRLRFDRVAGRMPEGTWAVAVDQAFQGSSKPVLLSKPKAAPAELGIEPS